MLITCFFFVLEAKQITSNIKYYATKGNRNIYYYASPFNLQPFKFVLNGVYHMNPRTVNGLQNPLPTLHVHISQYYAIFLQ